MVDLIIHQIAFGGRAFEPVSDAAKRWTSEWILSDFPLFHGSDICMTGFNPYAIGVDPQDFQMFLEDAEAEGLITSTQWRNDQCHHDFKLTSRNPDGHGCIQYTCRTCGETAEKDVA